MARTLKLNDLQLILLTTASQRDEGSLLPPPERLADQPARIRKVIPPLLKHVLIEEVAVTDAARIWREEDGRCIGLAITAAGRAVIGVEDRDTGAQGAPVGPAAPEQTTEPQPISDPAVAPATKIASVLELLRRPGGATLAELVAATGWLPHTMRAALTGLRKKGHVIDKGSGNGATSYIVKAAA